MFKTYQDKRSTNRSKSRMVQGGVATVNDNKIGWFEFREMAPDSNERYFTMTVNDLGRFDKIAFMFYGSVELEWVILQYNNIVDIQDVVVGDRIKIPSKTYVQSMILTRVASL